MFLRGDRVEEVFLVVSFSLILFLGWRGPELFFQAMGEII